jgi:tetratricopeptide (TPR) repeat protein
MPKGQQRGIPLSQLAATYSNLGRVQEAIQLLHEAIKHLPKFYTLYGHLAACFGAEGNFDEAGKMLKRAIQLEPRFSIEFAEKSLAGAHPIFVEQTLTGLRAAGLRETADD